jgi:lysozyme
LKRKGLPYPIRAKIFRFFPAVFAGNYPPFCYRGITVKFFEIGEKIMRTSVAGLELIKQSEGFRKDVYNDVAGFPTIGYGHRVRPGESFPGGLSEAQGADLLADDVAAAEKSVNQYVRVAITQGQFDALVDFCFNLGAGRLAASTLLRELNAGHYADAALQLLIWDHAAGQVNQGLKTRREAEYRLWMQPDATSPAAA